MQHSTATLSSVSIFQDPSAPLGERRDYPPVPRALVLSGVEAEPRGLLSTPKNKTRRYSPLALLAVTLVYAAGADAQTQRTGNDAARVMQQLQQVTAERSKLQQENEALKKELEGVKASYAKTNVEQSRLQQRTRELEAASSRGALASKSDSEALEKSRTQLQELIGKFRETAQTLKDVETDRERLRGQQTARERDFQTCVDRNAGLYLLGDEILQRLENRGVWSSIAGKEPFTQLSRTRLENLVDDYRYRIEELRLADKNPAAAVK